MPPNRSVASRRSPRRPACGAFATMVGPALVLAMMAGCHEGAGVPATEPTVADSAGVVVITHPEAAVDREAPFSLSRDPELRIGILDGPDEFRFTRIVGAVSLSDGSIAVLDAGDREVRLFDGQGSFVRRVGGPGEGPGEFRLPQLLERLPGDTLLVWDAGLTRLSWFDVRGTLIQEARVAPEAMGRVAMAHGLDDGTVTLVVAQQPGAATDLPREGTWRQEAALVQWESPEEEPRKWADVPGAEFLMSVAGGSGEMTMVTMGTTWHAPSLLTAASRGRIWRGDGARWELEVWDPARGEVEQVVRFDAPLEPFDEAFIRELHAHELDGVDDDARREAVQRRHRSVEYPDRIPPFRALRAGSDGRLWMGLTRTPPEPLPSGAGFELRDWLVLDGDGSILGRVVLPPRTQLLYAASDHILVVRFDELDLPYLERFRLEPPSGGAPGE